MRTYIIKRLLLMIPTLFIVSLIVFFIIRLVPGDAIDAVAARMYEAGLGGGIAEGRALIEHELGLDVPVLTQYGRWIGVVPGADGSFSGIFQGNFGTSFWKPITVVEEIATRWPVTLELGLLGIIIAQLIALPVGIFSALRQDTWGDYIARSFAILCIAVPSFWIATMVVVFPSIWWGYMIPIMHVPFLEDPLRNLRMFIVPAIVLGMALAGTTMRMTRTMMLEVLRQYYIRTAWAKGLRERVVILRHALKNALIPVITVVGLQIPLIIGGTVIIEEIFNLHGMGKLILNAIAWRDYPILSGILLILGFGVVLINLIVDLTYGFLDPRVRYR
ncbi:Glutathione transport system permease protein GsiC [subsurface metagenome]